MILLIDNYDSFSYNLYQLVGSICPDIRVVRNDQVTVEDIRAMAPSHLLLSPGPGRPDQAGICEEAVRRLAGELPILGICLGHQAICEALGGRIIYASRLMHGKQSQVALDESCPLFQGLPDCLKAVARTQDGEVMAVAHRDCPVYGLQFHPESILTPDGGTILKNFLEGN